jgi:hypothetical protein
MSQTHETFRDVCVGIVHDTRKWRTIPRKGAIAKCGYVFRGRRAGWVAALVAVVVAVYAVVAHVVARQGRTGYVSRPLTVSRPYVSLSMPDSSAPAAPHMASGGGLSAEMYDTYMRATAGRT